MSKAHSPLYALTRARVLEFLREPEAIFWVFAFPVIMAVVLGFAFRDRPPDKLPVGTTGAPQAALDSPSLRPIAFSTLEDGLHALRTGKIALLVQGPAPLT